jgi:hypothetical protein
MKVVVLALSLQLVSKSLQKLLEVSELRDRAWIDPALSSTRVQCTVETYNQFSDMKWSSANCSSCNTYGSGNQVLSSWVNCWPGDNYVFTTNDHDVHEQNFTSRNSADYIQQVFNSDCSDPSDPNWASCGFSVACVLTKCKTCAFAYNCYFTRYDPPKTTNKTYVQNYYTVDSSRGTELAAQCTYTINQANYSKLEFCKPLNYAWKHDNRVAYNEIRSYNTSSSTSQSIYFIADCPLDLESFGDCYWAVGCNEYQGNTNGFYCWVVDPHAETTLPANQISFNIASYDKVRQKKLIAHCNYTKSAFSSDPQCVPVLYQYVTQGRYNHTYRERGSDREAFYNFAADCETDWGNECHWITNCYVRSSDNEMSCRVNSQYYFEEKNKTTAFKYLNGKKDWCANCTYNNGTNSSDIKCQQCVNPRRVKYISTECNNMIEYFENSQGNQECANCTACTNGYYNCAPCKHSTSGRTPRSTDDLLPELS